MIFEIFCSLFIRLVLESHVTHALQNIILFHFNKDFDTQVKNPNKSNLKA